MTKKKTLLFVAAAASVAAILSTAPSAQAQTAFQDAPPGHWAFVAVDRLRNAGIVEGYPDKTYGGARPITRYEFAIAIARLMEPKTVELRDDANKSDLSTLRREFDAKFATKEELDSLRRSLMNELRPEIRRQRQAVKPIGNRVGALDGALPRSKPR